MTSSIVVPINLPRTMTWEELELPRPTCSLSFYKFNQCKDNARIGLEIIEAEGLHMVAGSLGINGHYEYGGRNWNHKKFKSKEFRDAHIWIEDKEGRIYDYIQPELSICCHLAGVDINDIPWGYSITGMEPKELANRFKMTYIPAEPRTQELIIKNLGCYSLNIETGELEELTVEELISTVYKLVPKKA